jgi:hypothetical protein
MPAAVALALSLTASIASAQNTYNFSTVNGQDTSTAVTLNGATFSSATPGAVFTFGPNGGLYSNLGAYVLTQTQGIGGTLQVSFAQAQTGVSFDFANADLLQLVGSDSLTVTTNTGFTETVTNFAIPGSDLYPQGIFNLTGGAPFTSLTISSADAGGAESFTIADLASVPVPLPPALSLLAGGLLGLGGLLRARRT